MNITGRDSFIIAQALTIAIDVMSREDYPAESNIEDMKAILAEISPGGFHAFQRDLSRAFRLGYRFKEGATPEDVRKWLNERRGKVVPLPPKI